MMMLGACHSAPPAVLSPVPTADSVSIKRDTASRFFRNIPEGSDTQFNPASVILNEGFDQLRTSKRKDFTKFPYDRSFAAVMRSVVRPDRPIKRYGVSNWLRNEVFPLSLRGEGGGQWYPNYTLHLFGSGVTYVRLADWYQDHGIESHPRLAAGLTTYAFHFLNEIGENGPTADQGVDALSDLLVFDAASIILWNQGWVHRLFTGTFEVNNWYGQVSLGEPGRTIENAYSMVVLRAAVPRTTNWKVTVTHGYMFLVGVSRRVGTNDWVTIGGGADAPVNPIIDSTTQKRTAELEPNGGIFYDRNGSLLASLVSRGGSDNGVTLNVYPGVLRVGPLRPSFWVQQNKGGGARFGISSALGIGISTHAGIPKP